MTEYATYETKRLLHLEFEGIEGATDITDSSSYNHVITRVGNIGITTSKHAVGSSCSYANPPESGDCCWSIAANECFSLGNNDFDIQWKSYIPDSGHYYCGLFMQIIDENNGFGIYMVNYIAPPPYQLAFILTGRVAGVTVVNVFFLISGLSLNEFHSFRLKRESTHLIFSVDDVPVSYKYWDEMEEEHVETDQAFIDIGMASLPISGDYPVLTHYTNIPSYMDELIIDVTTNEPDHLGITDEATYIFTQTPPAPDSLDIDDDVTYKVQTDGVWYLEETLTDPLASADSNTSLNTMASENDESLVLTDSHIIGWPMEATDALNIADEEAILNWLKTISESLALTDVGSMTWLLSISEILFIYDTLQHGWSVTNDESLVLTDSLSEVLGLMISDWITLIDSQSNNWNGQETINQTLNLYDIAQQVQTFADTITEDLTIADAPTWVLTLAILEWMDFADLATAARTSYPSVSESVVLTDEALNAWQEIINDTLQAVDVSSVIATFINVVQESLVPADTVSLINRLGLSLNDSLVLTETITSKGTLYNAVYDTLAMNVIVDLAGEVYECYILNTPKFHASMYSGFDFNSYCVFENRAFGANDTGIYELTGTTDAGSTIHTGMISSQTDFGLRNEKRFRRGYIGVSGASPVMILECEDGSRKVYTIDTKGKAVFSHEQKSKEWKLAAADFDTLDVIKLIPVILSK